MSTSAPAVQDGGRHGVDGCSVRDAADVGERFASSSDDLVHDGFGALRGHVVDDDPGAVTSEGEGVTATEAAARAGDDGDAAVKSDGHDVLQR